MNETILIGVAWPYANSPLHLGQLAGAYIPPDIFARYHRLRGQSGVDGLRLRYSRYAHHSHGRTGKDQPRTGHRALSCQFL